MEFPGRYKTLVLDAIQSIDLGKIAQVIQMFTLARAQGRRIFVFGETGSCSVAANLLCELVKGGNYDRPSPFRILALTNQASQSSRLPGDAMRDRVFLEQLKNFAEPEDVVMGVSVTGNEPNVVNAIEYATWIGCRTIGLTGLDGGKMLPIMDLCIQVPSSHQGSVEDAHLVICHMIGYYFADLESSGSGSDRNR